MSAAGHVFQEPGALSCLGCVAAMIAGDADLSGVAGHVGHAGDCRPFRITEVVGFLASRGYLLGGFADRPSHRWRRRIRIRWELRHEALLIVEASRGRGAHAVFWTGQRVLDPARENLGKVLADYKVLQWWPVMRVENHGEL